MLWCCLDGWEYGSSDIYWELFTTWRQWQPPGYNRCLLLVNLPGDAVGVFQCERVRKWEEEMVGGFCPFGD
ncbi:hypothetical protein DPEC_G00175130 [Dallia pectoralis]|uniref:Uncharacterized protein n=1 Tax=Dallia pectoralis TaxID=75939 RepID=A0ACC2GEP6_DALPE|nr:hypothetical protein DPEC_G00175130 [Dallia pectoralis]